jgi:hypothetical protein
MHARDRAAARPRDASRAAVMWRTPDAVPLGRRQALSSRWRAYARQHGSQSRPRRGRSRRNPGRRCARRRCVRREEGRAHARRHDGHEGAAGRQRRVHRDQRERRGEAQLHRARDAARRGPLAGDARHRGVRRSERDRAHSRDRVPGPKAARAARCTDHRSARRTHRDAPDPSRFRESRSFDEERAVAGRSRTAAAAGHRRRRGRVEQPMRTSRFSSADPKETTSRPGRSPTAIRFRSRGVRSPSPAAISRSASRQKARRRQRSSAGTWRPTCSRPRRASSTADRT